MYRREFGAGLAEFQSYKKAKTGIPIVVYLGEQKQIGPNKELVLPFFEFLKKLTEWD
jgi:hypothetical protein